MLTRALFSRHLVSRSLAFAGIALALAIAPALPTTAHAQAPSKDKPAAEQKTDFVEIIFKTGNTVRGTLISETESSIIVKITIAGIASQATYNKSEILTIKRNLPNTDAPAKASEPTIDTPKIETPAPKDAPKKDEAPSTSDDGKLRIYIVTLRGEFGRDVSSTPMKQIVDDIKKHTPDILILRFDQAYAHWGQESPDFTPDAGQFDILENARTIQTYITEQIMRDPSYTKKPRLVGWVKKALGGAAFLPFICPELYYTSDAHHGGIGYLDHLLDGRGDEVVRQKQYSLRMARARGMAELGGHNPCIMEAMAWSSYVLSYKYENGKVVFIEAMPRGPDEFLLTDSGEGVYRDSGRDILRFQANDVLTIDAVTAERIGLSKGTADTLDELLLALGITRDYKMIEGKSQEILSDWTKSINKAEADIDRFFRDYSEIRVKQPGGYKERTAARGQRKRILISIKSILDKYGEAINPYAIRSLPKDLIGRLDFAIYQIEQEQRLDKQD